MANFWVVENPGGGWNVKREAVIDPASHHDTQAEAIDAAHSRILNSGGGELVVQDRHGKIRQKDTIGKSDPYPPKG